MPLLRFFSLFIFSAMVLCFSACTNRPTAPDTFGTLDTARVAADTAMQANMDLSYEYQKTLVQNDSIVFDFLAYDRPGRDNTKEWDEKLIVIRRTNTRQDTVIRSFRLGAVKGLAIADLDQDGRPEILYYEDQTVDKNRWHLIVYSQNPDGTFRTIHLRQLDAKTPNNNYLGGDSFFVYKNHLIRRFPYYEPDNTGTAKASLWQSYKLVKDKLVLENEKIER
jgi:hypothetical protein